MDLVELRASSPGVLAEDGLDGDRLHGVAPRGRGAVHVDVVDRLAGSTPASSRVARMTRTAPSPSSQGAEMW